MARKFDFVSPGISIEEIDQSVIEAPATDDGLLLIGRALSGPSMQPTKVKNLADFLVEKADDKPIIIHGKAYKPDVPYCIGSYSTLVGYYVEQAGKTVKYIDPIADDRTDCVDKITEASIQRKDIRKSKVRKRIWK